jgi:hypothetical protein
MYELPTEIEIAGRPYQIRNRGDYRTILGVFSVLEDPELTQNERIISALIIFYEDLNDIEDVFALPDLESATKQMYEFFNGGKGEKGKAARKLIDWEEDSAIISSAVNKVAGIEIRSAEYIHWWTFLSYYMSVGECVLSTVVNIRDKMMSGKKLEKWEREYRNENPQYFNWNHKTIDEIDAEEWLKSVWNKE